MIFEPIRKFVQALNAADAKLLATAFVDDPVIIDDIPRHYWSGPTAIADWTADAHLVGGQTTPHQLDLRLERPSYVDVHGKMAYSVHRAVYKVHSTTPPIDGDGICTFAIEKTDDGWKIRAWTWTHTAGSHRRPLAPVEPKSWDCNPT